MKKWISSLLSVMSVVTASVRTEAAEPAPSDSDQWVVYERQATDGQPLVVIARTGNAEAAALLREGLATVIRCQAAPDNIDGRGMPGNTQLLYPLEDELDNDPALRAAKAVRVASVTGQGQRRLFFVHKSPIDMGAIIGQFTAKGFTCTAADVSDRQSMVSLVTPTMLERQLNGDRDVIASLQKNGDDGHVPRKTDFWFYGPHDALGRLAAQLASFGFELDHRLDNPSGMVLSRKMKVDFGSFEAITPTLVTVTGSLGVDYDGWETMVISR